MAAAQQARGVVGQSNERHTEAERRERGRSCLALEEARRSGIYTHTETIQDGIFYA